MLSIQSHGSSPVLKAIVVSERLKAVQVVSCMQLTRVSNTAQSFCCLLTPTSAPSIKICAPWGRKTGVGLQFYQ